MASWHKRRTDDLGLRHALSGWLLPLLAGAMVFLAGLAGAGGLAASALARHWRDAGEATTIQVADPGAAPAVAAILGAQAHRLAPEEVAALLRPWLGEDAGRFAITLPAVFTLQGRLTGGAAAALARAAPDALVARGSVWQSRLAVLAGRLQGCAALTLGIVAVIAAGVVSVATQAGLSARREAIEIVHGLGAADGMIAGRFAARVTGLAASGGAAGALAAAAVLPGMVRLLAPFAPSGAPAGASPMPVSAALTSLPPVLWGMLAVLALLAALIGWLTAQVTVRAWLGRLP